MFRVRASAACARHVARSYVSERETRTAERAPEALEVVDRRCASPSAAVVVAVEAAGAGAAARLIELPEVDLLVLSAGVSSVILDRCDATLPCDRVSRMAVWAMPREPADATIVGGAESEQCNEVNRS